MKSLNHPTTVPKKPVIGPAPEMVASILTFFQVCIFKFSSIFNCRIDILKGLPILEIPFSINLATGDLNGHMLFLHCQYDRF
jgi:hypothetical protein